MYLISASSPARAASNPRIPSLCFVFFFGPGTRETRAATRATRFDDRSNVQQPRVPLPATTCAWHHPFPFVFFDRNPGTSRPCSDKQPDARPLAARGFGGASFFLQRLSDAISLILNDSGKVLALAHAYSASKLSYPFLIDSEFAGLSLL